MNISLRVIVAYCYGAGSPPHPLHELLRGTITPDYGVSEFGHGKPGEFDDPLDEASGVRKVDDAVRMFQNIRTSFDVHAFSLMLLVM